ncbi:MAG: chemotaxis protein CheW [Aphanothece sp. CMT-3BRIN-NPC111]|jgi:purine-binding chemotaxis protein CheW|nr:chemotaxis protein CheW [Aphanothece sp. CMT-3BRIN-NPC111]
MESQAFIICSLNSSFYGIEAFVVQEIFYLPELTTVAEAPHDIVGVINLRGEILPVMDLHRRLGQQSKNYHLSDSVVVLNWEGFRIGIIVDEVHEVQHISSADITKNLSYGRGMSNGNGSRPRLGSTAKFLGGVAQVAEKLVMLLNHQSLIRYSTSVQEEITELEESYKAALPTEPSDKSSSLNPIFCPNATPEERAIFRQRAENLKRVTESEDFAGLVPLAVIGLNDEYFGLDLEAVREFTQIGKITPIPCSPSHIVGNINLRGEIVTLVDIRGLLNLPIASASTASKAMVVRIDDLVAGVTVDNVFDVMYVNPSQMMPVPAAVHSIHDEYIRGTAPYQEKMMSVLELPKILTKGGLTVEEEV